MTLTQEVTAKLDELKIDYKMITHPPVTTIEEMDKMGIFTDGILCKNLFLRNANGKIHYLVSCPAHKAVDLVKLRGELGCSRLSFGSDERLMKHMGLLPGACSPFAVNNNEDHEVVIVLDKELKDEKGLIGFHPNENTAFVWLKIEGLLKYIKYYGNDVVFVNI